MPLQDFQEDWRQRKQGQISNDLNLLSQDALDKYPSDQVGPITQEDAKRIQDIYLRRQAVLKQAEAEVNANPRFSQVVKDAILKPAAEWGLPIVDGLARILNFDTALQVGLDRGMIRSMKGNDTILKSFQLLLSKAQPGSDIMKQITSKEAREALAESLEENAGHDALLEELGYPSGPRIPIGIPYKKGQSLLNFVGPSSVALGLTEDILTGKNPYSDWEHFGLSVTPRGAVGLALDIFRSPITYMSFGSSVVPKMAAKIAKAGKSEKVIATFMNQAIYADPTLVKSVQALKLDKAGREVIRTMDEIVSAKLLGQHSIKSVANEMFNPTYKIQKPMYDRARMVERQIPKRITKAVEHWRKLWEGWLPEEKLRFGMRMQALEKLERKFPERIGKIKLGNPKWQKMHEEINKFFQPIGKQLGMTDELFHEFYLPAVREAFYKSFKQYGRASLRRISKFSGAQYKKFVTEGMVQDPEIAIIRKAVEAIRAERINNGFIKWIIKKYGVSAEEAAERGIKEFVGLPDVFKGTKFETKALAERALGEGVAPKKIFFPNEVVESLQRIAKQRKLTTNQFLKVWDTATAIWKTYQTVIWPAFTNRNIFSNFDLRFLKQGVKAFKFRNNINALKMIRKDADIATTFVQAPRYKAGQISLRKAMRDAEHYGLVAEDTYLIDEVVRGIDNASEDAFTNRMLDFFGLNPVKENFPKIARKMARNVEDQARLASYLDALGDGYKAKEAVDIAFSALFDYSSATKFEKDVMLRFVPFYKFGKWNTKLQFETLLKNPGRQALHVKLIKDLREDAIKDLTPEQKEAFANIAPGWVKNSWAIPVGFHKQDGTMWLTGLGFPQQDLFELFTAQGFGFRLNPLVPFGVSVANEVAQLFSGDRVGIFKDKLPLKEARFLFHPTLAKYLKPDTIDQFLLDASKGKYGGGAQSVQTLMGFQVGKRPIYKGGKFAGEEPILLANSLSVKALQNLFVARGLSTTRQLLDPNVDDTNKFMRFIFGLQIVKQSLDKQKAIDRLTVQNEVGKYLEESGDGDILKILYSKNPQISRYLKILKKTQG